MSRDQLSPAMLQALQLIAPDDGRELVLLRDSGERWVVRSKNTAPATEWPKHEWLGTIPAGTVDALRRRRLISIETPRLTPRRAYVTAVLTDAGRAAIATDKGAGGAT